MAAYRPRGPFRANGSFFQNVLRWGSSARWFGVVIGVMALGLAFWSTTLLSDSPPHRLSLKRDAGPPRQPRSTINTDFYSPKVNVGCDCDCQIPDIPTDNSCDYFTETDISSMPIPERECPEFQSVPLRSSYTGGVLRVPGTGTVQVSTRDFDGFRDWANPKSTGGTPHEIDPQWQTHQLPLTLQLDSEFVRVRQLREDGEVEFQEVHSDPQRNPSVPPMPEAERAKKPNIVVFTVDALSRKDATSSMPRAMEWLKNIQKNNLAPKVAYTFSLAVTPGHATANSMTPFLMGRNWMLNELDEAKVATSRYENPDVQPDDHLTYHARKNGYRTLYGTEHNNNMYGTVWWNRDEFGWDDHIPVRWPDGTYLHTCLPEGGYQWEHHADYMTRWWDTYDDVPKFIYYHSWIGHGNPMEPALIQDSAMKFIDHVLQDDNTLVYFIGDHGQYCTFSNHLPLVSLITTAGVIQRTPFIDHETLLFNQRRLVSHFDHYAAMYNWMYSGSAPPRDRLIGMDVSSKEIPYNRKCTECGVIKQGHQAMCPCSSMAPVPATLDDAKVLALAAFINGIGHGKAPDTCRELRVTKVVQSRADEETWFLSLQLEPVDLPDSGNYVEFVGYGGVGAHPTASNAVQISRYRPNEGCTPAGVSAQFCVCRSDDGWAPPAALAPPTPPAPPAKHVSLLPPPVDPHFTCPPTEEPEEPDAAPPGDHATPEALRAWTMKHFNDRAAKQCNNPNGTLWRYYRVGHFNKIVLSGLREAGIRRGDAVFESGMGCGGNLAFAHEVVPDLYTAGIDFAALTIAFANSQAKNPHTYCVADVTSYPFVPSNAFHVNFMFGVLAYLNHEDSCAAALEMVRVTTPTEVVYNGRALVRPGAVWIGSLELPKCRDFGQDYGTQLPLQLWRKCLAGTGLRYRFIHDWDLFAIPRYCPNHRYSIFIDKFDQDHGTPDSKAVATESFPEYNFRNPLRVTAVMARLVCYDYVKEVVRAAAQDPASAQDRPWVDTAAVARDGADVYAASLCERATMQGRAPSRSWTTWDQPTVHYAVEVNKVERIVDDLFARRGGGFSFVLHVTLHLGHVVPEGTVLGKHDASQASVERMVATIHPRRLGGNALPALPSTGLRGAEGQAAAAAAVLRSRVAAVVPGTGFRGTGGVQDGHPRHDMSYSFEYGMWTVLYDPMLPDAEDHQTDGGTGAAVTVAVCWEASEDALPGEGESRQWDLYFRWLDPSGAVAQEQAATIVRRDDVPKVSPNAYPLFKKQQPDVFRIANEHRHYLPALEATGGLSSYVVGEVTGTWTVDTLSGVGSKTMAPGSWEYQVLVRSRGSDSREFLVATQAFEVMQWRDYFSAYTQLSKAQFDHLNHFMNVQLDVGDFKAAM